MLSPKSKFDASMSFGVEAIAEETVAEETFAEKLTAPVAITWAHVPEEKSIDGGIVVVGLVASSELLV